MTVHDSVPPPHNSAPPLRLVALRLWVAVTHRRLDRRLAQGADPAASAPLALRAHQLTSRAARERLAKSLEELIVLGEHPSRWSVTVKPAGASIRAAQPELQRAAATLRGSTLVYARGIALIHALMRDPESPMQDASETASAWYWAQLATQALDGNI